MQVKIVSNMNGAPEGKLADAELHFKEGLLVGLKLVGFSVWARQRSPGEKCDVSSAPVCRQRRAASLHAAAGRGRYGSDGAAQGAYSSRLCGARRTGIPRRSNTRSQRRGHSLSAARLTPRSSYSARLLRNAGTSIGWLDVGSSPAGRSGAGRRALGPGSSSTGRRSTASGAAGWVGSGCRQFS